MYDVIVYSGTVLPALGPFKKISLSGYSTLAASRDSFSKIIESSSLKSSLRKIVAIWINEQICINHTYSREQLFYDDILMFLLLAPLEVPT